MNQDRLQLFPSQDLENRQTECVGETISDIVGNLSNVQMDAGFSYAATLKVMNEAPTTAGSDPYSGVLSAILYGCTQAQDETFTAQSTSELYEANFDNYSPIQKSLGQLYAQNGLVMLSTYQEIVDFLSTGQGGVVFPLTWYSSFMTPLPDGTLPMSSGTTSNHCTAVYEATSKGLRMKAWLGENYGDSGYCYFPEALWPSVAYQAWGFNKYASRWWNVATIAATHWNTIPDALPILKKI